MSLIEERHEPSLLRRAFFNSAELRAGWRLLIYLAIVAALLAAAALLLGSVAKRLSADVVSVLGASISVGVLLLVASIMGRFERRTIADYGLPWRGLFGKQFWQGAFFGFATMTILVAALYLAGVVTFSSGNLTGAALIEYSAGYALFFLLGALFEEFSCRGYLLFTLTTGVGFWPGAILSSILFGALHTGNSGETWFGCFSTGVFGFLFCVMLRRSGNLWMPAGFHAAYNWAEAFFYGTPDSGSLSSERVFTANFEGPEWLTGGSAGPEGSYLCVAIILLATIAFAFWKRESKFPDPAALHPQRAISPSATVAGLPPRADVAPAQIPGNE